MIESAHNSIRQKPLELLGSVGRVETKSRLSWLRRTKDWSIVAARLELIYQFVRKDTQRHANCCGCVPTHTRSLEHTFYSFVVCLFCAPQFVAGAKIRNAIFCEYFLFFYCSPISDIDCFLISLLSLSCCSMGYVCWNHLISATIGLTRDSKVIDIFSHIYVVIHACRTNITECHFAPHKSPNKTLKVLAEICFHSFLSHAFVGSAVSALNH